MHKSQGSEFPVVIIPVLKSHFVMLRRNLVYTALTRGRKKVFLVGDPAAYAMAVRNADDAKRVTGLRARLGTTGPAKVCNQRHHSGAARLTRNLVPPAYDLTEYDEGVRTRVETSLRWNRMQRIDERV